MKKILMDALNLVIWGVLILLFLKFTNLVDIDGLQPSNEKVQSKL